MKLTGILLTLALGIAFGCNSSAPQAVPVPSAPPAPQVAPTAATAIQLPTREATPTVALPIVSQADIGNNVGDHIPPFNITLVDGTEVSSESLLSSGKPVFLFFTATW